MNEQRTSKFMSLMLRHKPEKFGLTMDKYGFVDIDELSEKSGIPPDLIKKIVETDRKGRYSIVENKIRANYGHSIPIGDIYSDQEPVSLKDLPEILYHGTSPKNAENIKIKGLLPMKRKYVHLSPTKEWALEVGSRMAPTVIILEISVPKANELGVKFWIGSPTTIVCTPIPTEAILFP